MTHRIPFRDYYVQAYTAGQGEPIVFLHGWPTNAGLWQDQVDALSSEFRTLTFDWLGFGQSDKPLEHDYSLSSQVATLDTVLKALVDTQEQLTLVVHDIGGPPGMIWALENPQRIKRLILLNTVIYPFKTQTDALSERIIHTPILKDIFVSSFGLNMVMKTNTKSKHPSLNSRIQTILAPFLEVPKTIRRSTLTEPLTEGRQDQLLTLAQQIAELDVPKSLIIAREDPLLFKHIQRFHENYPAVPAFYLDNCGHYIPIDRPDELNALLMRILQET